MKPTLRHILAAFEMKNWFEPAHGPYMLNIVGVRTADDSSNAFNDWICFFRQVNTPEWEFHAFPGTTDPGLYWRLQPENVDGVAIVVPGQYPNLWEIGYHRGAYEALVQVGKIDVWRDNDKNEQLTTSKIQTGKFGINLHRASANKMSTTVDKWSAGCQVLANPDDFKKVLQMAHDQVELAGVQRFGYTLLEEVDINVVNV